MWSGAVAAVPPPWAAVVPPRWAVIIALCFACGDEDRPPLLSDSPGSTIPGCESFSYELCDILAADCQRELFALMACARNEDGATTQIPPVLLMTQEEALAAVEALAPGAGDEGASEAFAAEVRALELLGLVEAGLIRDQSDVLAVTIEALVAFYLTPTREIVIIDRGDPLDDLEANATLAHEIVHALQDARHGLAQFTGAHGASSDAALAATSVIEGEATFYQLLMMFSYDGADLSRIDYRATLDNIAESGTGMTLAAGSPMLTAPSIFPYTHGARYAGAHWLRGQESAIDALYVTPPASSLEVMAGGWTDAPRQLVTFAAPPEPLPEYVSVSDDVAGAWVLFGLFGALSSDSEAPASLEELAGHWRGDRIWMYQGSGGDAAALWAVAWDDAAAAERAAAQLARWAPEAAFTDVSVDGSVVRIAAVENEAELDGWVGRLRAVVPQ